MNLNQNTVELIGCIIAHVNNKRYGEHFLFNVVMRKMREYQKMFSLKL